MDAVERALDAAERRGHAHDGVEQHAVLGVDGIEHGVARFLGEDIDHGGRAHLDVGDVGGGDEHRGGRPRQLERGALVDLERERRRLGRHELALAERPARRAARYHRRRRRWRGHRRRLDRHRRRRGRRRRRRRLHELRRRTGRRDGGGRRRLADAEVGQRSAHDRRARRNGGDGGRQRLCGGLGFNRLGFDRSAVSRQQRRRGRQRRRHGGRRTHRPHGLGGALGLAAVEIVGDIVGRRSAATRPSWPAPAAWAWPEPCRGRSSGPAPAPATAGRRRQATRRAPATSRRGAR